MKKNPTSLYLITLFICIIQIHQLPTLPNILLERRHPNSTVLKRKSFLMHWQNSVISVINVSVDNSNWKNIWKKLIIWPLFKHNRIKKEKIEFIKLCYWTYWSNTQYGHSQSEKKLGLGDKYHRSIKVHT